MIELGLSVLGGIVLLLFIFALAPIFEARKRLRWIHDSVVSIIFGFIAGLIVFFVDEAPDPEAFDRIFFDVLLPAIIFCAGFLLDSVNLSENIGIVALLGFVGTMIHFICFTANGFFMLMIFPSLSQDYLIGSKDIFIFAAVMSATDSVAVLSALPARKYPVLNSMLAGEATINDAVSIVLFHAALSLVGYKIGDDDETETPEPVPEPVEVPAAAPVAAHPPSHLIPGPIATPTPVRAPVPTGAAPLVLPVLAPAPFSTLPLAPQPHDPEMTVTALVASLRSSSSSSIPVATETVAKHLPQGVLFGVQDAASIAWAFCSILVGSVAIGLIISLATAAVLKRVREAGHYLGNARSVGLVLLTSYAGYLIGDASGLSGIMVLFVVGLVVVHYTRHNLLPEARDGLAVAVEVLSLISEALCFAAVGFYVFAFHSASMWSIPFITLTVICIVVARAISVATCVGIYNTGCVHNGGAKIGIDSALLLWLAGLTRGSLSFALALSLPSSHAKEVMVTSTFAVVIFSCIVCGLSTKPLIHLIFRTTARFCGHLITVPPRSAAGQRRMPMLLQRFHLMDRYVMQPLFGGENEEADTVVERVATLPAELHSRREGTVHGSDYGDSQSRRRPSEGIELAPLRDDDLADVVSHHGGFDFVPPPPSQPVYYSSRMGHGHRVALTHGGSHALGASSRGRAASVRSCHTDETSGEA